MPDTLGFDLGECDFEYDGDTYDYADAVSETIIFEDAYWTDGYPYTIGTTMDPLKGYWFRTAVEGVTMIMPHWSLGEPSPVPPPATPPESVSSC